MENKNSEELIYLKNALRKAESEKEKINAERDEKNKQFREEYDAKEYEIADIQKKIKELEAKALKNIIPKYFKTVKNDIDVNIEACKVTELNVSCVGFILIVDEIFDKSCSISHEKRTMYRKHVNRFIGSTIVEALSRFSKDYIEITEEEYNEYRKKAAEAIMKDI